MPKRNTTRNSLARRVELGVGVVALVVALALAAPVLGWHRPSAPVAPAPAGPSVEQLAFDAHQRAFEAQLVSLDAQRGCVEPGRWRAAHPNAYPVRMIVQPVTAAGLPTWGLVVKPWSFSSVGGYVKGLCVR